MQVTKPKLVGLSVGVALLGSGLIATLLYFLLKKQPSCAPCTPCKCFAEGVGAWEPVVN